ncbi:MAG: response regulator transcription factor [Austwickia sp.]|nr:response regulator transcription factor [Actinomycetota bacterium]MCB1253365.1 response regulator transcription factor [Austwickia sp.]MCO5311051.1 response regulator transcription factor [Austwickia sp.]
MSHILIAEDEPRIAQFVESGLRAAGHLTTIAADGETALLLARSGAVDMVVLDIGLPRLDGLAVLTRLREEGHVLPVILLTARDGIDDKITGLEGGANDYMTKPFAFGELLARIRLRLGDVPTSGASMTVAAAGLTLDLRTRRVTIGTAPDADVADLTAREFGLLEMFLRHPDHVLSREQIIGQVWGWDVDASSNVVDVFVKSLRAKIGSDRIETVRGMGYRLRATP